MEAVVSIKVWGLDSALTNADSGLAASPWGNTMADHDCGLPLRFPENLR